MNKISDHFGGGLALFLLAVLVVPLAVMLAAPQAASREDWPSIFPPKPEVRLITARTSMNQGIVEAGVYIRLGAAWKTYAENPGKTGIAPKFDWSGSRNLKSARLFYPRPSHIEIFGSTIIGYEKEVVFPVKVEAVFKDRPLHLQLDFSYAICADLCVPLKERFSLTLPPGAGRRSADAALLRRFMDKVPQ